MQRFAAYTRVSDTRGREGESFISPDVQREKIAGWAKLRGVEIVDTYEDLDVTGGVLVRPGLDALMEQVRRRQVDGIAVAHIDRLSRAGVADALRLIEEINEHGAQIAVVDLGLDPTTPFGEFGTTIMLALARMQRRQITENWSTAQERAVARGIHIASKAPTGYARGDDGRLTPDPKGAPIVAEIFRLRASGASWRELATFANERGLVGPYGSPHWRTRALSHVIGNPAYLGQARCGTFVNRTAHPAIIDRATWEAAQVARGVSSPRNGDGALLSGLLRCAGCRHLIKPDKMTARDGSRVRLYRCRGEHSAGTCQDRAAVLGSVIEPYVIAEFMSRYGSSRGDGSTLEVEHSEAVRVLEAAESELATYLGNDSLISIVGADRFNAGAQARAQAVEDARSVVAELHPLDSVAVNLADEWDDLATSDKRKLLASVFDGVVLRTGKSLPICERAVFIGHGAMDDSWPRRGRRVPLAPFVN